MSRESVPPQLRCLAITEELRSSSAGGHTRGSVDVEVQVASAFSLDLSDSSQCQRRSPMTLRIPHLGASLIQPEGR